MGSSPSSRIVRSVSFWTRLFMTVFCFGQLLRGVDAEAHPHQGVVKPFVAGDPNVKLSGAALKTLAQDKPYQTQIQSGSAGRGLVVQDVRAPVDTVWATILDFDKYQDRVPKTAESERYKVEQLKHGQQRIWVRLKVGFPMLKLQFFIEHLYDPAKKCMVWTLDYSKKSDFDDSVGYWYVIPHPDNPTKWTRVYYSVEVSMFSWVPKFVVDFMSKQALTDATAWVKKYSELQAAATDEAATNTGGTESRRPKGGWRRFLPGRKKVVEDETCESDAAAAATVAVEQEKVGLTRYALVTGVLALTFYNVYLYSSL